jgi:hypothetical protein
MANHLDFDSAIPRFESWRPSQQVIDLALFLRPTPNAREQRAFATSDVVCASQTRRKGVKFGVCLSGANLASVLSARMHRRHPRGKRKIREPRDFGWWAAPSPTAAVKRDSAGAMQRGSSRFPHGVPSLKIARRRMRRAGRPNHRERVEVAV